MSATANDVSAKIAGNKATTSSKESWFDFRWVIIGMTLLTVYAVAARWYQGWAAWEYGTEATDPMFDIYWMRLMYVQLAVFGTAFFASLTYMWVTRDKQLENITPELELRRYMRLLGMLLVYAFAFVFAGSFFAEQDAAWHQVVMRDTSFTPSHIVLFYGFFPAFIVLGFASYAYAMTRLPLHAKGISYPLLITVIGPMMVFPNVGYNEWGHAFWFMEEYFTAPLHWGFVIFGWAVMALGGVLVQVMARVSVLMKEVFIDGGAKA